MSYKVPYYATVGIFLMLKTEEGAIAGLPVALDEIGEGGIEGVIETLVKAAASRGMHPLTAEEHAEWAAEIAAVQQRKELAEIMKDHAKYGRIDHEKIDRMLANHKSWPGGDA
jgi:hypothetical protein